MPALLLFVLGLAVIAVLAANGGNVQVSGLGSLTVNAPANPSGLNS